MASKFHSLIALSVALVSCSASPGISSTTTMVNTAASTVETTSTESVATTPVVASDGIGDPLYPSLGNAGYDVQHSVVSLRLDTSSGRLQGTTRMEALALEPLDSWTVDLDVLFPSEVLVDGVAALWNHEGGELRIDPDAVIGAGDTFLMEITYGGLTEPYDSPAAIFNMGFQRSVDGFFVLSEPDGTSSWLPVNDHPLDKSTYEIQVSVPGPLVAAASGTLVEVTQDADGFIRYTFSIDQPIAPYLLALAVGDFRLVEEEGPAGLAIRNYFDADLRESSLTAFERQGEMIEFLSERFGPYPFDVYGALVLETEDVAVALETQTLSTFGTQILGLGEDVVIHELAHQWFGDSVSVTGWDEIWINEGFATYSQWLWAEETGGPAFRDVRVAQAYELMSGRSFLTDGGAESIAADQAYREFPPPGTPRSDDLFNASVYLRAALTLHALRIDLGDEEFFALTRLIQSRYRFGNVSTEKFIETASEVAGRDMTPFFEGWLYAEQMPPIPSLNLKPLDN